MFVGHEVFLKNTNIKKGSKSMSLKEKLIKAVKQRNAGTVAELVDNNWEQLEDISVLQTSATEDAAALSKIQLFIKSLLDSDQSRPSKSCSFNNNRLPSNSKDKPGSSVPTPESQCDSVLVAALQSNDVEIVSLLVDVYQRKKWLLPSDATGWNVFHITACNGSSAVMEYLLKKKKESQRVFLHADPNGVDSNTGLTPLACAAINGHPHVVQALLNDDMVDWSIQDNNGWNIVFIATLWERWEVLKILKENRIPFNIRNSFGTTPLHQLVRYGKEDFLNLLLTDPQRSQLEIDVNILDSTNKTPLHSACIIGDVAIVSLLVLHGADLEIRDIHNRTPLFYAVLQGHYYATGFLISRKANADITDGDGKHLQSIAIGQIKELLEGRSPTETKKLAARLQCI